LKKPAEFIASHDIARPISSMRKLPNPELGIGQERRRFGSNCAAAIAR
jgi:hypothetical protein